MAVRVTKLFSLPTDELEDVVADLWWEDGRDTLQIAEIIGKERGIPVSEARVAKALARVRDTAYRDGAFS